MPTPQYGPKAGQYIPESEMAAYTQAYGLGQFTWTEQEQADRYNAAARELDPNWTDLTPEQNAAQEAAARNAAVNAAAANATDPNGLAAARAAAARGQAAGPWDAFFANGVNSTRPGVGFDTTNQDQSRAWQQQVMQDLQRQAAGDPNSRAQQQLSQGYADARAGQSALGSTMRGTGGAAGLRHGVMGAGSLQRGYAGDQQMLMAQEQQSAQAALAQMLAQQRQQDAGQAQAMAGNAMGNQRLDDALQQYYTQGTIGRALAGHQYGADLSRAQLGFDLDARSVAEQQRRDAAQAAGTAFSVLQSWGGGNSGSGYRQVGGQDSIVPIDDK